MPELDTVGGDGIARDLKPNTTASTTVRYIYERRRRCRVGFFVTRCDV